MATVSRFTTPSKPPKAYYAHLYDEPGTLTKLDDVIYFLSEATDELTAIEPEHCPFLMTLGEIGLADTQALHDKLMGGYAKICTSRPNYHPRGAA